MNNTSTRRNLLEQARKATLHFCNTLAEVLSRATNGASLVGVRTKKSIEIEERKIEISTVSATIQSRIGNSKESGTTQSFIQHNNELVSRPDYLKLLESRVKQLELENLHLKRKLWKLRVRGRRTLGIILTCAGGASLVGSYMFSSMILTFIGIGLTLWGAVIFYIMPSRQVPEKIIPALTFQMIKTLDNLLVSIGCKGRAIFYHKKFQDGSSTCYMFVPYDNVYENPENQELLREKILQDTSKGISIVAPSQGLVELFERELNVDFVDVDLAYVHESLSKLLVEDLNLIDDLAIENDNSIIHVKIVGSVSAHNCDLISKRTQLGNNLGCPLCGAFAIITSKVTGRPVMIKDTIVSDNSIETSYITFDVQWLS